MKKKRQNAIDPNKPLLELPKVGDLVRFFPSEFVLSQSTKVQSYKGKVIQVNPRHRCYTVEAQISGYSIRETYKF